MYFLYDSMIENSPYQDEEIAYEINIMPDEISNKHMKYNLLNNLTTKESSLDMQ
jgi:hypothetical protein